MSVENNKAIVRRFHTELWAGNVAVVDELLHPDYESVLGKPEDIKNGIAEALTGIADAKLEIIDLIGEGDKVVMRWRTSGVNLGPSPTPEGWLAPPTGKPYAYTGITINELRNGKIISDVFENGWCAMVHEMNGLN